MNAIEGYVSTADGVRLFYRTLGRGPSIVIPNGNYFVDDFHELAGERTLIAYDPRNRGRSDQSEDGDIERDVEDLEAVRRHFEIARMDLIGHSYMGLMVALYGMKYPGQVNRVVQIGPMEPVAGKPYQAHLKFDDGTGARVIGLLTQLRNELQSDDEVERCRKMSAVLAPLYVADPADAGKIDWGRCELPNERNFLGYWMGKILPSIRRLRIAEGVSAATMPVLTIHGTKDRSAPYGGGREWALMLPDARLVTIDGAAHAPWIEAPEKVFAAVRAFFGGSWPEGAEKVERVDATAAST